MGEAVFRKHGLRQVLGSLTLSNSQRAVSELDSSVSAVVFGVPGSGKTTALKALALNRLRSGLKPSQLLVISATRDSATALRDQLAVEYQGSTQGPMARTLSSFAFNILRDRALGLGMNPPELITGSEQDQIISQLVADFCDGELPSDWPKQLKSATMKQRGFRAELRDLITVALEHRLTAKQLKELGVEHAQPVWQACATFYEGYLRQLREPENLNRHDPSTLLTFVVDLLSEGNWPQVAEELELIIVDDAQELTPAASALLESLCSHGAKLVLIGDPDVATMGFRAADPSAMRKLITKISKNNYIQIDLNDDLGNRNPELTKVLAKTAKTISPTLAGSHRKVLGATSVEIGSSVETRVFDSETSELSWLANRLRVLHLNEGIAWRDIVVVARSRSVLERWASKLASESVPTQIQGNQTAFKDEFATGALLRLAKFALGDEPATGEQLIELLRSPFSGLDSLGIRRIRRQLRQLELNSGDHRTGEVLIQELFAKSDVARELYGKEGSRTKKFLNSIREAKEESNKEGSTADEVLWVLWNSSTMPKVWLNQSNGVGEVALQANRNLDSIAALFAAAKRFAERHPLVGPLQFIDELLEREVPQDTLALIPKDEEKVTLATSSSLIGRRFKVVALPGLVEGVWPNLKPRSSLLGSMLLDSILSGNGETDSKAELEDEQRLLHKAVGAASERIIVSSVSGDETQISQFVRLINSVVPEEVESYSEPRYTLRGLVGKLRNQLVSTQNETTRLEAAYGLSRLALDGQPGADPAKWAGIIDYEAPEALVNVDLGEKVWIFPSQLEAFVKCPLHWFMQAHGGTNKDFEANFGTLLHKVLEETKSINYDDIWSAVESKWYTLEFDAAWIEKQELRKAQRMVRHLTSYLQDQKESGYELIGSEVNIEFELGAAKVQGRVDRIEQGPDGQVLIVDLKTGKYGEAKENPQLGLYQIAFLEGAFEGITDDAKRLQGAQLLMVNQAEKYDAKKQDSLEANAELEEKFRAMISDATVGMAGESGIFAANIGTHCYDEHGYGNCKILLTQAVTFGD